MSIEKKIIQYIHELPEHEKAEVLDFIDYLKTKGERKAMKEWAVFPYPLRCETWELKSLHIHLKILKNPFHDFRRSNSPF